MTVAEKKYVLAIDSGSTGIRAMLFDVQGIIKAREYEKTPAMYPSPGAIEHDPMMLWESLLSVVKNVLSKNGAKPEEIYAIGITNQRGSFTLWDRDTGKPLVNFINWADVRAAETVDGMNQNSKWKMLKKLATIVSKLTNNPMMTTTSLLNFTTDHATSRLKWVLDANPELRQKCKDGKVMFGTIDTWFIYNLTGKQNHVTDYSNAASTGLLNPFVLQWNDIVCKMFDIPMSIFPKVIDNNGDFGRTNPDLFGGVSIPIRAAMGDQQAALFGQCCFEQGDVKISQGSGAFVDMNVGNKAKVSKRGLFPLIAWHMNNETIYMLEGYVATAGTLIDWLGQGFGLSDTPKVLNELAAQCTDTEGVIFVPSHSGIRFPYFNPRARGSVFGLSLSSHRRHVARAVLEGIASSLIDIVEGIEQDTKVKLKSIKVDGGVSKSDILLQIIADLSNIEVRRAPEPDMTATGAAYMAGLGCGLWKDLHTLKSLEKNFNQFTPSMDPKVRAVKRARWKRALNAVMQID
jgi:glycerol kinase